MPLDVQKDISLAPYNSMAVSVKASVLASVASLADLYQAVDYAQSNGLKLLVLGEGSNTLFRRDFNGLVVLNRLLGIEILSEDDDSVVVRAAAGENWHGFVRHTLDHGWFGLENLALIPGLVGAAPMQNIGAYGVEVKDTLLAVDYLEIETGNLLRLSNAECGFAYRDSRFKHELAGQTVITSVTFKLSKKASVNISYPALANHFESQARPAPTPQEVFDLVCQVRSTKLPLPSEVPNAGSFFKNPVVSAECHEKLKKEYPQLVSFAVSNGFKLAAGWMIEQAGWKDKSTAGVGVHHAQALVLVNPGCCSGEEVLAFAEAIQTDIFTKFNVMLEIEPRVYG